MTRFFIDDKEIAAPERIHSCVQFLKYVEESQLMAGRVVHRIFMDGKLLTHEDINNGAGACLDNQEKVEIFTSTLGEISKESISEAMAYLARVEKLAPALCAKFQDFPDTDAFQDLRNLYEGYSVITLLLEKLATNYCIKLEDTMVREISIQEHLHQFVSVLKQLIDCKQNGDYALIADILEYEIIPGISKWKEIFNVVQKKITMLQ